MALEGFDILPQADSEEVPLPTPLKETTKRNNYSVSECVLPNERSSSTLLLSSSPDHSMGSVAERDTHVGQSWADSRSRHSSDSSEEVLESDGLLQDYVVVSSDDLPMLEGVNDRLYTADEQTKKKTCQFKKLIITRIVKHHTAPITPDQRSASHEVRPRESSAARNRIDACTSEVARVPPVGKEKEEPELSSSFYSEETGGQ